MLSKLIIFLVLNFTALALGSLFTSEAVSADWYLGLNKAPWTPPGWVFGVAWTTIMICFCGYMAYLWTVIEDRRKLIILYTIQWILNVAWNPTFFYYKHVLFAFIIICALTILIGYFLVLYRQSLQRKSLLLLPYFGWLLIATSLNAYILLKN